jgi:TolA-binding protein
MCKSKSVVRKTMSNLIQFLLTLVVFVSAGEVFAGVADELKQAHLHRQNGRHPEAEQIYANIIQQHPGSDYDFQARWNLAITYILEDKLPEAEAVSQQLFSEFSQHEKLPEASYLIAEQYEWGLKFDKAKSGFQQLMQNHPGSTSASKANLGLARIQVLSLMISKDYNQAKQKLAKLVTDFPSHPNLPDTLFRVAERYEWSLKFEDSKNVYQQIVQNHPASSFKSRAQLSSSRLEVLSLLISKDYSQAQQALDTLVTEFAGHPDLPETLYRIAERYGWLEKFEEAKNIYQQIIQNYPNSPAASKASVAYPRANIMTLATSKNFSQAQAALDNLITNFPNHPDLAATIFRVAKEYEWHLSLEDAKSRYQQVIQNYPYSLHAGQAAMGIARVNVFSLIKSKNYNQAETALDKLITDYSGHPDLSNAVYQIGEETYYMASLLNSDGHKQEAKEYFARAIEVWQKNINELPGGEDTIRACYSSAAVCQRIGQFEKAVEYYQKLVSGWPDHKLASAAQFMIGQCLERMIEEKLISPSETKASLKAVYQQVVDNYPNSPDAEYARTWIKNYESEN